MNRKMEENKPKRPRRTRAEIEAKVFDAIRQLADTKGLSNINFADICQYADVQPIVLNRNYETMEKLLDKYAYTCDYWLHDLFNSQHPTDQAGKDILKNTLQALAGHLYDNPDMQRLLTWELSADNEITRRMARSREMYYKAAIEEYNRMFANTDIPIDTIAGLLVAGTYCLILRLKRSTFVGVDYQKKESRERLYKALDYLSHVVFQSLEEHDRTIEIARKLKQKGIDTAVIAECTDLPVTTIEQL